MTQILKKDTFETKHISEYYKKYYKSQRKVRLRVLDYMFRYISFVNNKEKICAINSEEYNQISKELNLPKDLVHKFISKFLVDLVKFHKFIERHPEILHANELNHTQPINLFLWRIYKLAPVFDYKRARENARRLKKKLDVLYFWPQIMTQVATVIFITDYIDKNKSIKLKQLNLRVLCQCSAYAFHRTRNKIGLTTSALKSL
jgi:hypothetical protein